ncbi:hypothetical protein AAFF_G00209880 [Aldrovandia affinis]|uniref:Integrase catalytic domain-containing protein n=1 Tax=Aldrovandia affinis TaxID=143900 RepID=A0AAD7WUQ1_9TELE|nr:hypothetical protein AAFF_G00209880 [Aldrovandia affinis]
MESSSNFEGLIAQLIASIQAQQVRHEQKIEGQWVRHDQLMAEQQQHTAVMRAEQFITAQEAQAAANLLEDHNLTSVLQQVSVVDGRLMNRDLCKLMKITKLCTLVYHLQTDGLVERFNQTLKHMLKKVTEADGGRKIKLARVPMGEQLDPTQRQDMLEVVGRNWNMFSEEPGHTELARHPIIMEPVKKERAVIQDRFLQRRQSVPAEEQPTGKKKNILPGSGYAWCSSRVPALPG